MEGGSSLGCSGPGPQSKHQGEQPEAPQEGAGWGGWLCPLYLLTCLLERQAGPPQHLPQFPQLT